MTDRSRDEGEQTYWERHGWNATVALCFGVGAVGLFALLFGVDSLPTPRLVDTAVNFVLFLGGPLLGVVALTGFGLALWSVVAYYVLSGG